MRYFTAALVGLFLAATPAFAAKSHREAKKKLEPAAKTASTNIKGACGCAPAVTTDWKSFEATKAEKAEDYARNIQHEFDNVT